MFDTLLAWVALVEGLGILALVGLMLIPLRGRNLQHALPFGCFLAPAALTALLVGRQAVDAYFSLLIPPP